MTVSISFITLQIILAISMGLCLLYVVWTVIEYIEYIESSGATTENLRHWSRCIVVLLIGITCAFSILYIESKKHQHKIDQLPAMWRELYRQVDRVPRELRDKFVADAVANHHFPPCSRKELQLITSIGDISFSHLERFVNDNPEFHP